ncbi:hypothetical protein [Luteitalea sp.]|uniref:hypothetical protein n=1 Tax=Luteitalea sp. TaxID=2004800 RepID=UPI0037CBFA14
MRRTRAAAAPAWRYVLGGMLAAALAVAGNLAWRSAFPAYSGYSVPALIDETSVTLASALSVLLAAGVYLLLSRGLTIATPLYVLGSLLTAAASCVATYVPVMPDGTPTPPGFTELTLPMHLFAGVMAAVVVPLVVLLGVRAQAPSA